MLQFGWLLVGLLAVACNREAEPPLPTTLKDSFAQQLTANKAVKNLVRDGDDLKFSGPGPEGADSASWRVHFEAIAIAGNDDPAKPYKGVVRSSWYADDRRVMPSGANANLPLELIANGLAQECWAFWDKGAGRWSWE